MYNKGRNPFFPIFPPFYIDSQISVHQKFKKIDQLIFRNAKEIYFNEKFPIFYLFTLCKIEINLKLNSNKKISLTETLDGRAA